VKYRHSLRNWLVVIGSASIFAGRLVHKAHGPALLGAPLAFAGVVAVLVGFVVGSVLNRRYVRAVARDRKVWGWASGSIPGWAARSRTFPLAAVGPVLLDDVVHGYANGNWLTMLTAHVKPKARLLGGQQDFQVIGMPVADWVPRVQIMPVGKMRTAYQLVGGRTIDFESAAFNAVWHVVGDDARKVHDVVHPRAMERLLLSDARDVPVIIDGGAIWTWRASFAHGDEFGRIVRVLYDFANGIPKHLDVDGKGVLVARRSNNLDADVARVNGARG